MGEPRQQQDADERGYRRACIGDEVRHHGDGVRREQLLQILPQAHRFITKPSVQGPAAGAIILPRPVC